MPDLINPEYNDGIKKHIVWKDELCASCLNAGNCPLLQCVYQHTILSHSGIHVANCDVYRPDLDSEYYIPPMMEGETEFDPATLDKIRGVNVAALQQQVDALNDMLRTVIEEWDTSSATKETMSDG